jgi:iron complex transport system substrate-binding protein
MRISQIQTPLLFALVLSALAVTARGIAVYADDPTVAPETTLSANGLSATDGVRTLSVSKAFAVSDAGESIQVQGLGYNEAKGVYVTFCVIPEKNDSPTPCGGGIDLGGDSGSSFWISSNPPSYGQGLATPYGFGGSFAVNLNVAPVINSNTDCRVVRCAIVTRNDHTRSSDRSQDIFVPVTFGDPTPTPPPQPTDPPPQTGAPGATVNPTTTAPTAQPPSSTPAPATSAPLTVTPSPIPALPVTLSDNGRKAIAGDRTLTVSKVKELSAAGEELIVAGRNFDDEIGIYVSLCAVRGAGAPGPCSAGSNGVSAWVSSNPPDYARDLATPYISGGTFDLTLVAQPVIDSETDCREVTCAIVARRDDTNPDDRSQDMIVPVTFSDASVIANPNDADSTELPAQSDNDGSSMNWLLWAGLALVLGGVCAAGAFLFKRRYLAGTSMLMLFVLMLAACSSASSEEKQVLDEAAPIVIVEDAATPRLPATVTSFDGREVTVNSVERIVPLWGNISEVVFGLGLGDNVVGRDVTATFPEASDLPLVTRAHDVSAESVLSLHPTVVLASENSGPSEALNHIRNVGIPVVVFKEPASVDEVTPRIRDIAAALGVSEAGEQLVAHVDEKLDELRGRVPASVESPRVAFLYMRGQAGVYLIGGRGSGADSMIEAVGGVDAGAAMGLDRSFTPITSEALVEAAPDIILMTTSGLESVGGIDGLIAIPGIGQTPAGSNRRIVTVEDGLLYSFGPRTPYALEKLLADFYGDGAGDSS